MYNEFLILVSKDNHLLKFEDLYLLVLGWQMVVTKYVDKLREEGLKKLNLFCTNQQGITF